MANYLLHTVEGQLHSSRNTDDKVFDKILWLFTFLHQTDKPGLKLLSSRKKLHKDKTGFYQTKWLNAKIFKLQSFATCYW